MGKDYFVCVDCGVGGHGIAGGICVAEIEVLKGKMEVKRRVKMWKG